MPSESPAADITPGTTSTACQSIVLRAATRQPHVIADLAGLRFIDASGVAVLARGRNQARHAGGELLLARRGTRGCGSCPLTRLTGVFPVDASVDEARRPGLIGMGDSAELSGSDQDRLRPRA